MLVCPDRVTIEPLGSAALHPDLRQPMGRRTATQVTVYAQVEIRDQRRLDAERSLEHRAAGDVIFDTRDLSSAGYTPKPGDRLVSVVWALTGSTQSFNLYLGESMEEGAGDHVRCRLSDRSPAKADP